MSGVKPLAELREACDLVAAEAAEAGHDLHAWTAPESPLRLVAYCRGCGARFRVSLLGDDLVVDGARAEACRAELR